MAETGITRQAAEPAVIQFSEGKGLPGDGQLPEADFTQLFEYLFGSPASYDGDAAGADDYVGLPVGLDKRLAQSIRIVGNNAKVNHLAAQLLKHQVNGEGGWYRKFAVAQRLARQLQFIPGREDRDAHFCAPPQLAQSPAKRNTAVRRR